MSRWHVHRLLGGAGLVAGVVHDAAQLCVDVEFQIPRTPNCLVTRLSQPLSQRVYLNR